MAYNGYPNYPHYPPGYEPPRYPQQQPVNLAQTSAIPAQSPVSQTPTNQYPNGTNIHHVSTPAFPAYQVDVGSIPVRPPAPPIISPPPPRNRKSPSGRKIKKEQSEGHEVTEKQSGSGGVSPHTKEVSQLPPTKSQQLPTGPPSHMIQEFTFMDVTIEAPGQKSSTGKKGGDKDDKQAGSPPKAVAKGRKKQQGMLVDINHVGRDMALAEQALKRRRVDGDEPIDDSEDIALQNFSIEAPVRTSLSGPSNEGGTETKVSMKRPSKSEGARSGRRDHHACDRCFRNKTKCSRAVDGKPPSKHFPCDYCVSIQGICSNAIAQAKKPESVSLSDETHWKQWKFKDIINSKVEQENLDLRRELDGYEKKFTDQARLHEAVKAHNTTLEQNLTSVNAILKGVVQQKTYWQNRAMNLRREIQNVPEDETDMPSVPPSIDFVEVLRIGDDPIPGAKYDTSLSRAIAERDSNATSFENHTLETLETMEKDIQTYPDVLSAVTKEAPFREYKMPCVDMTQLHTYVRAYFANVHPLLPVLHQEAFLRMYRTWAKDALGDGIQSIEDTGRPGRAVCLIWSVAALGALSLVETRDRESSTENHSASSYSDHLQEALGFYRQCLKLLIYTRETIESMLAYLLVGVFAIQTMDPKEAFRRLQNFQTQALSLNLSHALKEMRKKSDVSYDYDLWPDVTNFIVIQMVARAWCMFKSYLSSVALELGLLSNIATDMEIDCVELLPQEIDDEVCGYDTKKEYCPTSYPSSVPNPITYVRALEKLASIRNAYSTACWIKTPTKRIDQLAKYQTFWSQLSELESELPPFLDWNQRNSALSNHPILSVQRPFIEAQIACLRLKLARSIADLDPALLDKFRSMWDIGYLNSEAMRSGSRVIEIVRDIGINSSCYRFYHFEVLRTLISLVRLLLGMRKVGNIFADEMAQVESMCREGVELSRRLVPLVYAKVEEKINLTLDFHHNHPLPPLVIHKKEDEDENMEVNRFQLVQFENGDPMDHDGFDFLGHHPYSDPDLGVPFPERSELETAT